MVLLSFILLVISAITGQIGDAWKGSRSKVEEFQGARLAFETVKRNLSQATLNTYYDYFDSAGRSTRDPSYTGVDHYGRQSDLHFISGKALVVGQLTHAIFFQTPGGYSNDTRFQNMNTLLNACGFYLVHGKDTLRPTFLSSLPNAPVDSQRYRLMQFFQPSQQLKVYGSSTGTDWFTQPLTGNAPPVQQLSENIVALILLPRKSTADANAPGGSGVLTDTYEYDSRLPSGAGRQSPTENQLPPLTEIVLVAIDEASARRLGNGLIQIQPDVLFQESKKLDLDLAALAAELVKEHLNYRIFRSTIPLRSSKWTS